MISVREDQCLFDETRFAFSHFDRHPRKRRVYQGDETWLQSIAHPTHTGFGFIFVWNFFHGVQANAIDHEVRRIKKATDSIRRSHPGANITMILSHKIGPQQENQIKQFDINVDYIGDGLLDDKYRATYRGKLLGWMRTPYEKTIYLDMDMFVCQDIAHMLPLLDRFDFLVTEEPTVHHDDGQRDWDSSPLAFFQYNTGIVFFSWNPVVRRSFAVLLDILKDTTHDPTRKRMLDQRDFREMVWHAGPRVLSLPPTYACRTVRVPDGVPTCVNTKTTNHYVERPRAVQSLYPCYVLHGNPAAYA